MIPMHHNFHSTHEFNTIIILKQQQQQKLYKAVGNPLLVSSFSVSWHSLVFTEMSWLLQMGSFAIFDILGAT